MPKKAVSTGQETPRAVQTNYYDPVPEGTYYGKIKSVKWESFPNTKANFDMEKFIPTVVLFNSNRTHIDRQNLVIGAVDADGNYTGDVWQSENSNAIMRGYNLNKGTYGAMNFMHFSGMLNEAGVANFNEEAIIDLVGRFEVRNRSYTYKNVERQENVITHWSAVSPSDWEALFDAGVSVEDLYEYVSYTMCLQEPIGDTQGEFQTLTFADEAAFNHWYETFYGGTDDWSNVVGLLGGDLDNVGVVYWSDYIGSQMDSGIAEETVAVPQDAGDGELPM